MVAADFATRPELKLKMLLLFWLLLLLLLMVAAEVWFVIRFVVPIGMAGMVPFPFC